MDVDLFSRLGRCEQRVGPILARSIDHIHEPEHTIIRRHGHSVACTSLGWCRSGGGGKSRREWLECHLCRFAQVCSFFAKLLHCRRGWVGSARSESTIDLVFNIGIQHWRSELARDESNVDDEFDFSRLSARGYSVPCSIDRRRHGWGLERLAPDQRHERPDAGL